VICEANIQIGLNLGIIILVSISFGVFFFLPLIARLNPPGFQIFPHRYYPPYRSKLRYITAVVLAIMIYSCLFACVTDQLLDYAIMLQTTSTVIWIVILTRCHYEVASAVGAGGTPGLLSQDPAMLGFLITTRRISDRGSEEPEFGDKAFKTGGILLNRRNGAFYFLPGTYAQEQIMMNIGCGMVIVPENQVITFLQDTGADAR
jgi:hypothetical protein